MRFASLLVLGFALSCDVANATSKTSRTSDAPLLDSQFSISSATQVPGAKLKPGKYTITITDHFTGRVILQVTNSSGKTESTFLGVPRNDLSVDKTQGPIALSGDKPSNALLGYTFPGGRSVEFVYPKAEAAALTAKTNGEVLAIDPASDNLHGSGDKLSRQDAAFVTLWSLQISPLAGGQTGIAAKKYVASAANKQAAAEAATSIQSVNSAHTSVKREAPPVQSQKAANKAPALETLPHTASNMPLFLLCSVGSLCLAAGFRVKRSMDDAR